jgi:vacuolar-type H+-ATPase subunit D/Vma8
MLREEIEKYGIRVNIAAEEEHIPEVERQIRVIKERARSIVQTLPYHDLPKKKRIAMIHYIIFWLNLILKSDQDYSPKENKR